MAFLLGEHGKQAALSEELAVCLECVRAGQPIDAALSRYPADAAELEPLLRAALAARSGFAAPIRESRRLSARSEFLQAAARQSRMATQRRARTQRPPSVLTRPLWSAFAPAVAAAALFVVALVPIMSLTSTNALPGDWNYGFKRSAEVVRLALTLNPADRLNLELAFHDRRLGELEQLAASGRLNDPTLVEQLTNETSALVQTVSHNPQLGPSEALKVVQQTQAQVQALNDKIAPLAPASVKPAITNAVQQTQQVEAQANEVAQAKVDAAQTQYPHNGLGVKNAQSETATATPSPTPTATAAATETATASPSPSPSATPATSGTVVAIVPPPQAPPIVRAPAAAGASAPSPSTVLQPPSNPQAEATGGVPSGAAATGTTITAAAPRPTPAPTPAPLVPPVQPPNGLTVVRMPLPAGQQTPFVYNGPALPIPQALASIAGQYDVLWFSPPGYGGAVYPWYPGQSSPNELLEPGTLVTIHIKPGAPAILTYEVPGTTAGH